MTLSVPATPTDDTVDVLHGVEVPDPYRWLEQLDSPQTRDWVAAQSETTEAWLAANTTGRAEIRRRLGELLDYTRRSAPARHGDRWFSLRHDAGADQPVLVVADCADGDGRVLIDPREWSGDGPVTSALASVNPSPDGSLVAYAVADAGSDWMTWRVRDVATGADLPDVITWSKYGSVSWLASGAAFVYPALDPPSEDATYSAISKRLRIMRHVLGTPQSDDELWHEEGDDDLLPGAQISDDGRWLVVWTSQGTRVENDLRAYDLDDPARPHVELATGLASSNAYIGNTGSTFFLMTDDGASRRRIVTVESADPSRRTEIVAERGDLLLGAVLAQDALVCHWLRDAASTVTVHGLDGTERRAIDLPADRTVGPTAGSEYRDVIARSDDPVVTFGCTGFTEPGSVWSHDVSTGETRVLHRTEGHVESSAFVTERATATSADGTDVPMFLIHRRDVVPDGDVRVLLYGYGGFDIPMTPAFQAGWMAWVERGGLLAVANLRGGGEFGREWYDAGRREHKQNVFDDMCGCAAWLASSGWSRPGRIAINGGSNGGLLVGACITQHPELFGAAVPQVGVLDMYRFHKFTGGWMWTSDYGDPDVAEEWQWQRGYSPLHNIHPGTAYPPTMVTTGDHDDRVVPAHSYKFAATLQQAQSGDAPVLLRVDIAAGHGAGKPISKSLDERADILAFMEAALQ